MNTDNQAGVQTGHGKVVISSPPEIEGVYYKETFTDPLDDTDFGAAWSTYSSDPENARNERIDTEPGLKEAAKYSFTNLGATGRYGPTSTSGYNGTSLEGKVTLSNGIQQWKVPETGTYTIETWGAQGNHSVRNGGYGARMRGDFDLTKDQTLNIVVGQQGGVESGNSNRSGGGGGGTFVYEGNTLHIAAGGGGGHTGYRSGNYNWRSNSDAESGNNGNAGCGWSPGSGGQGGSNGYGGSGSPYGGAGAGWNSKGGDAYAWGGDQGGQSKSGNWVGGSPPGGGGVGGFGGGGAGGVAYGGGGGGGGYSGGGGGTDPGCGGGAGSYNSGDEKSNQDGVNMGHGKVEIIRYEELEDPGFDAYDPDEENGPYCWVMDTSAVRGSNLNELTLHIGLTGEEESTSITDLSLSFAALVYGDWTQMDSTFQNHGDFDGVAVSKDGVTWQRAWSPSSPSKGEWLDPVDDIEVDITGILANLCPESKAYKDDFYLKFQQYGSGEMTTEGIVWDEIYLLSNGGIEFLFEDLPQVTVDVETDPEEFSIFALDQGDPDEATVTLTIKGGAGGGGGGQRGGRGDPIVYTFTNCGAAGRFGPTQNQVDSTYQQGNTLYNGVTRTGDGIQEWTVPKTGTYTIEAWGAQGGYSDEGYGARMKGDFELTGGEKLQILVGQKGTQHNVAMSGGGGSFVAKSDDTPLLVAGGGGGRRNPGSGARRETTDGHVGIDGRNGFSGSSLNNGGKNGYGGTTYHPPTHGGGGGAGFLGDGSASNDYRGGTPYPPLAFVKGGRGGYTPSGYFGPNAQQGGFGGGAAGGWGGAGGAGGYSGGGSDNNGGWSGGGGSYNDGANPDNGTGVNSGDGKVQFTFTGPGAPAGASVRLKYENVPAGLIVDPAPPQDGVLWSSEELEEDQLPMGDEYEVEFTVSSIDAFIGSIGELTLEYLSWDEDATVVPVDVPELKVQALDHLTLEGDVIANNGGNPNDPGSQVEIKAWSVMGDEKFEFPVQTFTSWDYKDFDQGISITIDPIPPNQATIYIDGGTPGDTGVILATHTTLGEMEFPVTLTWGPADSIDYDEPVGEGFIVGEKGGLMVRIIDAYGNSVDDWSGKMYVRVRENLDPPVEWEGLVGPGDNGYAPEPGFDGWHYYEFIGSEGGAHLFVFTPFVYHGFNTTTFEFGTIALPSIPVPITVIAGPVEALNVLWDVDNIKQDNPDWNDYYYAGDPLYFLIEGLDGYKNPSGTFDAQILVTHDGNLEGDLEPEPWRSVEGNVIIHMVDGTASNYDPDPNNGAEPMPFKFFTTETVTLTFRVKTNMGIANISPVTVNVNPTSIDGGDKDADGDPDGLRSTPAGTEDAPVTVATGDEVDFDIDVFDLYGNEIGAGIRDEKWTADKGVRIEGGEVELSGGKFEAIEFFAPEDFEGHIGEVADGFITDDDGNILYSYKEGYVHAEITGPISPPEDGPCPRETTEVLDIPVRVLNDYDVWLDENEIWPDHVLANEPLELTANIHYKIPADELVGDLLEIKIKFALVELDENGEEKSVLFDLHQENIRLLGLYEKPEGIYVFHHTVPQEFFRDYVNYMKKGAEGKSNHIKVVIEDVSGGSDMKLFQKSVDNDQVIIKLNVVVPPQAISPSFAPSVAFVGLALLGLAVGSTLMSRRRKKGRGKDDDAVSPVIAIILMVAITIVLAGVLWLWVSGLVATGKEETLYKGFQSEWIEKTDNKDYQLLIKAVDGKNELSVEDLRFTLYALDKSDQTGGQHKVTNVYGKPISDQTFISFHDGDHDGMLSIGDRFILKSFEHVNDDGTIPDGDLQGKAKEGFTFELRAGKTQLFETKVK